MLVNITALWLWSSKCNMSLNNVIENNLNVKLHIIYNMQFKQIVQNYDKLYRIGKLILKHTETLPTVCSKQLDKNFEIQHARIEKFETLAYKTTSEWNNSKESINKYWTGF